jgi:homocysteine S-methyltransferase
VTNPLLPFLADGGVVVLDGGLATELERRGADLRDHLWSARLLLDQPDLIVEVHEAYLAAGSDVIATASYQASLDGLARRGLTEDAALEVIRRSVVLGREARDRWLARTPLPAGRLAPLVAGSVGPYGAALADGSEYRGGYQAGPRELEAFHLPRLEELAAGGPDLIALETFPSVDEAVLVLDLLRRWPALRAWVSFSTRDETRVAEGPPIEDAVRAVAAFPAVAGVGVNCLPPDRVEPLLRRMRRVTDLPLAAYPNSGESWDPVGRCWVGSGSDQDLGLAAVRWYDAGARLIGGCCRTTPATIRLIRRALEEARQTRPS